MLDAPLPASAANPTPCSRRGWCIFEQRVSSLVKSSNCFLRLGTPAAAEMLAAARAGNPGEAAGEDGSAGKDGSADKARPPLSWATVIETCASRRAAPLAPDAFEAMMRDGVEREAAAPGTGIRFTSGKDLTEVTT